MKYFWPTPLEIEGAVRRLEAVEDGPNATGALTLALRATRGADVVVEHVYEEQVPAASRRPKDVAEALRRAAEADMRAVRSPTS